MLEGVEQMNRDNNIIASEGYVSIENVLAEAALHELTMDKNRKKEVGCYYTDINVIRFMLDSILKDCDLVSNPFIKILDPSCGCGYFLSEAYDMLKDKFIQNMNLINERFEGINLSIENIHDHIVKHNIYGADMDETGVKLARMSLMLKNEASSKTPNIICCDTILDFENTFFNYNNFWDKKFDIIIGNPPYIGHKKVSGEYRKTLNRIYGDIFKDKADISFCFIKSSIDRLSPGGKLMFITSRYFMESPNGKALRNYIKQNCEMQTIIDFYGVRIMKGISVDPVIIQFKKCIPDDSNRISIIRAKSSLKELGEAEIFDEVSRSNPKFVKSFSVMQKGLDDDGWLLCSNSEINIIEKIENHLDTRLSDICVSYQGIITGCDRAFIINNSDIEKFSIERDIIKPWIKSSSIKKYRIAGGGLYIIYADFIGDLENYPHALSYIEKYRERLEKRRECMKGTRKWFHLQWGRESRLFEMRKIIFPYKASYNRFAIDEGSYSSADVYGMYIKDKYKDKVSYEFLAALLNSRLYNFYFKGFAKKLGEDMYEYYPNTVMRMKVPDSGDSFLADKVKYILSTNDIDSRAEEDVNRYIYKMFGLTPEEIDIVERGYGI